MFRNSFHVMFCILFAIVALAGCVSPTEVATLPTPADTQVPATATQPPPTVTPVPPTPTLEPSPTESALLVEPGKIVGKVDIGGRNLYIRCVGEGSPTVILEYSEGMDVQDWGWYDLYQNLTKITRTCYYDRASLGNSDPAPTPRTAQDMVDDLHTMLVNAQIPSPYVLVGWSVGGWIVRLYAGQYPDEVVGMVLLESLHPDQGTRISEVFPTKTQDEPATMTSERNYWSSFYEQKFFPEEWDLLTSAEQVRAVSSLGDIPLLVLSSEYSYKTSLCWTGDLSIFYTGGPENRNQIVSDTWFEMQRELAALSTNGTQKTVKDTTCSMYDAPEEIINGVKTVVRQAQASLP